MVPTDPVRPVGGHRRAAAFAKPASALSVGDYLQIQACPSGEDNLDVDEGYARVEWVGHLDPAAARRLFAAPEWANSPVTGVGVFGVPGLLLLANPVRVLVAPNEEHIAYDTEDPWSTDSPDLVLDGLRPADPDTQRRADAALRPTPPPDEQDLYDSEFDGDQAARTLHVDGVTGYRPVPLSQLPWPGQLYKCAHQERAEQIRATYPDDGAVWLAVNPNCSPP